MNFSDFNSFFEIFTVINLAYAGSKDFQEVYDNKILKINESIKINIDLYSSRLIKEIEIYTRSLKTEIERTNELKKQVQEDSIEQNYLGYIEKSNLIRDTYNSKKNKLISQGELGLQFSKVFKTIFLMTGLFCLSFIILSGFHNDTSYSFSSFNLLIIFSGVSFLYNTIFLGVSCKKGRNRNITFLIPFSIIILIYFISFRFLNNHLIININKEYFLIISLFLSINSFLYHLVRIVVYKKYIELKLFYNITLAKAYFYDKVEMKFQNDVGTPLDMTKIKPIFKKLFYNFLCLITNYLK